VYGKDKRKSSCYDNYIRKMNMNRKIFFLVISGSVFVSTIVFAGTIQLPQTGQTTSYSQGDDGEVQTGVSWPDPRFTVGTGAESECATDNLTGLMWPKNANLPNGTRNWQGALGYIASINSGAGLCGYTDWRLPNRKEISSLIDYSKFEPALPSNHPFTNVQSYYYWSSTTFAYDTSRAWLISIWEGPFFSGMSFGVKASAFYVWPVRLGQIDSFDYYCDEDNDNHKNSSITNSCQGSNCIPAGCQITPGDDCNDSDANNWISCASCMDSDNDNYFINCDAYLTISGPDCNDGDANNWISCASCMDSDIDNYFIGCDDYTTIDGPDCNDGDPDNWSSCATCGDGDTDTYYAGCDAYTTINGPDCDDNDIDEFPGQQWKLDADTDGYSPSATIVEQCARPANYRPSSEINASMDCDDSDLDIYPDGPEVRIFDVPSYFWIYELQTAYDDALDGETIQGKVAVYTENLTINQNKTVIIEGGYTGANNCGFTDMTGETTISGDVIISNGAIEILNGSLAVQ
jgi:hypothetical protein